MLELEQPRKEIRDFNSDKARSWRSHPIQLVDELLESTLPDYPITYVSNWGVAAPFEGFEGHVLNVWAKMLPGFMRTMEAAQSQRSGDIISGERIRHPTAGNKLIQFLGYDNSFFFTVAHLALAFASGGQCIIPTFTEPPRNVGLNADWSTERPSNLCRRPCARGGAETRW